MEAELNNPWVYGAHNASLSYGYCSRNGLMDDNKPHILYLHVLYICIYHWYYQIDKYRQCFMIYGAVFYGAMDKSYAIYPEREILY